MASAMISLLVLALLLGVIALLKWKFTFTGPHRRDLARVGPPEGQPNLPFTYGFQALGPAGLLRFRGRPLANSPGVLQTSKEQRAEAFLRRIMALTGATMVDGAYVLNVGKVQFQLRDRFIRRVQNPGDPKSPFEETCFYLIHNGMPKVEEIATALLHLSNNPKLFDKWALQNGVAFKADGEVFDRSR
jgi:hypothetical protein